MFELGAEPSTGSRVAIRDRLVYIHAMMDPPSQPTLRGRPREFDPDTAVARAMGVFWSSGYHGTSLPDLLAATKLSRGSLYAAFGDKHGLFLRALDRYIDDALARLDAELGSEQSALAGLRRCLAGYIDRTSGAAGERGCLVVATAMELAAVDAEVKQRIGRFFTMMETRLAAALACAQTAGDLAGGVDPETAAHVLLCLVEGMRVVGKAGVDRAVSEAMVDTLIQRFAK